VDLGNWINYPELGKNSRPRESKRLDWIQSTGLINPNQAETPESENPGDWIGSRRLDLREFSFKEGPFVF
jgi:hypothetical protein